MKKLFYISAGLVLLLIPVLILFAQTTGILENPDYKNATKEKQISLISDKFVEEIPENTKLKKDTYEIEIQDIQQIKGGIQVFVRAFNNDEQIGFGKDGTIDIERIRIFNPPILVPDPLGTIEQKYENPDDKKTKITTYYSENIQEALTQILYDTIRITGKSGENIISGKVGNTTDVFYPSADGRTYWTGTADTLANIRSNNGTGVDSTGAGYASPYIDDSTGSSGKFTLLGRPMFAFDTSSITDTDTIDSGTFSFVSYGKDTSPTGYSTAIALTSATMGSGTGVSASDFQTALNGTRYATDILEDNIVSDDSTYNDFTLNASGLADINKTGYSDFAIQYDYDLDNTTPTGWCAGCAINVQIRHSEQTGTTLDPKLTVIHSVASATSTATSTLTAEEFEQYLSLNMQIANIGIAFIIFALFMFGLMFYFKRPDQK